MIKILTKKTESSFQPYKKVNDLAATPTLNFTGTWATVTASGSNFTMTLTQNGSAVDGSYISSDGAYKGVVSGTVSDRTLVYRWSGGDGQKGSGKFTLSDDGATFEGSWTYSDDPNIVEVSWNGTRQ